MKCKFCGAELGVRQIRCAYCGEDNEDAIALEKNLNKIIKTNNTMAKNVVEKNKKTIFYSVYKKVTLGIIATTVITLITCMIVIGWDDFGIGKKKAVGQMKQAYSEGNIEELYNVMDEHRLFDPEKYYDYSYVALLYHQYTYSQSYFARAYEKYVQTGKYDQFCLERAVKSSYDLLSGDLSYVYNSGLSRSGREMLEPYRERVKIMLYNNFKIPEDKLMEFLADDYKGRENMVNYVKEVLPNE